MNKSTIADNQWGSPKKSESILEKELVASEIRYRRLFESAKDGILILDAETGKIADVNPFLLDLLGYTKQELIERSVWELGAFHDIYENKEKFLELQQEEYVRYDDLPLVTSDGRRIQVEFVSNIYLAHSRKVIQCNIRDITERKKSEEILRESEQLYRSLFENMLNGFAYCKMIFEEGRPQDFIYLAVNNSFEMQTGLKDVIGKKVSDVIPNIRQSDPVLFEVYGRVALTGKPETIEIYVGALKMWYSMSVYSPKNEHFVCTFDVIDKRKNSEEVLRQSEAKFRNLIKSLPDPVLVVDSQGRIVYCNENAMKTFDYTIDELHNCTMEDLIPKHFRKLHTTLRNDYISEPKSRAMGDGKELFAQRKGGKEFPTEVMLEPVEINGKQFTLAIVRDITERKKIEQEIKFQANLLGNVGQAVIATDLSGHVIYWNNAAEEIYGWSSVEAIGENIVSLTATQSSEEQATEIMKKLSEGDSWTGEFLAKRKDGSAFPAFVTDTPILDAKGNLTGITGISTDITERKDAEMELVKAKEKAEESDRLKTAFLANMSHEIRTPMNGILGFTELLLEPDLSSEKKEEYINIVNQSGQRMLNTVNDLMEISKIEAGIVTVDFKKVNVQERIHELIRFFTPEATKKGLKLFLGKEVPDATFVTTDKSKLDSILTNLMKNAIKYTPSGEIKVGCKVEMNQLEFSIKDTGIGIQEERQKAIFERFVQAELTNTRQFDGSGLGLAITRAYVDMLGGEIGLESKIGEGSTFFFTLPICRQAQEETPENKTRKQDEKTSQLKGLSIIIAEDDYTSALFLKTILSKGAHTITITKNGHETVEACRNNPDIDIVLMDIQMPGLNGYDATREIRGFNKEVIVIAQTALALTGDYEKAIDAGCNDYLAKPITKEFLLEKIQEWTRG